MPVLVFKRQNHNTAKLTEHDVYLIKGLLHEGLDATEIAEKFDVTKHCIYRIKAKQVWKHVPDYEPNEESA